MLKVKVKTKMDSIYWSPMIEHTGHLRGQLLADGSNLMATKGPFVKRPLTFSAAIVIWHQRESLDCQLNQLS